MVERQRSLVAVRVPDQALLNDAEEPMPMNAFVLTFSMREGNINGEIPWSRSSSIFVSYNNGLAWKFESFVPRFRNFSLSNGNKASTETNR